MMDETGSRERILAEATRLFARKGFAATSVREVVEAAGTSKPTLYYYFASKDGLFRECVQANLGGLAQLVDLAVNGAGSARDRLVGFLDVYVRGGLQNPDTVKLLLTATNGVDAPCLPILETFRSELGRLAEVLAQGEATGEIRPGDHTSAVRMLCGAADIVLFSGLQGEAVPDDFAERLVDLLYRGIAR
ncbi:MAG: TetR/AcrR family transcriptional regulator [Alphaproteobacteria bacterium]|nr:TetR/AcrR family transcriptional regulator [Alphaproteobacteria bacterium]MCB9693236.1 TetR/AcrR family transcriptional regulator [Alphaproteobacteria bacterium]